MNGDTFSLIFVCLIIAIVIVWYELNDASKVHYRPGCHECARHKAEEAEKEKRRQEQLAREWEERSRRLLPPGAGAGEDTSDDPPKSGGWMV